MADGRRWAPACISGRWRGLSKLSIAYAIITSRRYAATATAPRKSCSVMWSNAASLKFMPLPRTLPLSTKVPCRSSSSVQLGLHVLIIRRWRMRRLEVSHVISFCQFCITGESRVIDAGISERRLRFVLLAMLSSASPQPEEKSSYERHCSNGSDSDAGDGTFADAMWPI